MATKFAPQKKIFSLDVELSSGGNVAHQPVLPPCLAAMRRSYVRQKSRTIICRVSKEDDVEIRILRSAIG
jgi:hypothetical protein